MKNNIFLFLSIFLLFSSFELQAGKNEASLENKEEFSSRSVLKKRKREDKGIDTLNKTNCPNEKKKGKIVEHDSSNSYLSFSILPYEILLHVFSYLDQQSFIHASHLSKDWRNVAFMASKGRILNLSNRVLGEDNCQTLITSPFFWFSLQNCQIGDKEAEILSRAPHIKGLDLFGNYIGDLGVKAVANGNLTSLTTLNLGRTPIGVESLRALGKSNLIKLTSLNLERNNIKASEMEILGEGDFRSLTFLNLAHNRIGAGGVRFLKEGNFNALTSLNLECNNIEDEGLQHLKICKFTVNLVFLNLRSNNIKAGGIRALVTSQLPNLKYLDLQANNIDSAGVKLLTESNFIKLTHLNLASNNIGLLGAQTLAEGKLISVTHLDLENDNIGTVGAQTVLRGNLESLVYLNLSGNNIGYRVVQSILSRHLKTLTFLNLTNNSIGNIGTRTLEENSSIKLVSLGYMQNNIEIGERTITNEIPPLAVAY